MKSVLITAPSGGGKSTVIRYIKENNLGKTTKGENDITTIKVIDFDNIGYHSEKSEWIIPVNIVKEFERLPVPTLAAGMCGNIQELLTSWYSRIIFFIGYDEKWLLAGGEKRIKERLNTWGWHQKPVDQLKEHLEKYNLLVRRYEGKPNVITLDITKSNVSETVEQVLEIMK